MMKLLILILLLTTNLFAASKSQECVTADDKLWLMIIDRADASRFDFDFSDYPKDMVDAGIKAVYEPQFDNFQRLTGILQYGKKQYKGILLGLGYLIFEKTKNKNELIAKFYDTKFVGGLDPKGKIEVGKLRKTFVLTCKQL